MNILFITVRSDFGGGPEHVAKLTARLSQHYSVNVFFAAPKEKPYWDVFLEMVGKNKIVEIPHRKLNLKSLLQLRKFVIQNKIDIIHSHGKGAGVYSRIVKVLCPRVKIIHTLHGYHTGSYGTVKSKIYAFLEKAMSLVTSRIINVAESEKNTFIENTSVDEKKCCVIVNGIVPTKNIKILYEPKPTYKICFLSRNEYQKNIFEIIEIYDKFSAMYGLESAQVDIYGETDDEFEKIILKDNKKIYLKGNIQNVHDKFHEYDLFVNTSRWEGLPLSVLEAMGAHVPVLASDVVGNNSVIVDGQNGFLYPIYNTSMAAQRIGYIFKNKEEVSKIIKNASGTIEKKFSLNDMVEKTYNEYKAVL